MNAVAAWYNFPFLVALACSVLFALLQIIGGIGDHDADVDVHADAHVDVHADVHADVHTDVEHPDAHGDVDADGDVFGAILSVLGVGRVPLMLVLMAFLSTFGISGLIANLFIVDATTSYPGWAFVVVLLVSLMLGVVLGGRISRLFGRLAPDSSTAITLEQLVGRVGIVVSPSVSPTYGRVQVRDVYGSLHTVYAVTASDTRIPEHNEVALLDYDAARRCFVVQLMQRKHV